jgi:hypothetical protein
VEIEVNMENEERMGFFWVWFYIRSTTIEEWKGRSIELRM